MKTVKLLLCLFVGLISTGQSQTIEVLNKSDVYRPPLNEMVVMDKYTFGKYDYTAEKCDTLKREIKELDSIIQQKDSIQNKLVFDYSADIDSKAKEINLYKLGYEDVTEQLQTSIVKSDRLLVDYKKLENKRNKTKRWRNFFMGTTALCSGILILLVIH